MRSDAPSCAHCARLCCHLRCMVFGFSTPRCSACRYLLLRINSRMVVASGSYSVTDPIRCRSTASGSTAGRSTAVGQRHFPFGAQSGIAKFNSYFIPPTLAFLLSLLLRLGQWSRVSLQQHAVAGIGRETRSPAFPSASRSSAKFNIGAANMRLGYY
jgi:hypothetical protein